MKDEIVPVEVFSGTTLEAGLVKMSLASLGMTSTEQKRKRPPITGGLL
jgi:hypothetical protein